MGYFKRPVRRSRCAAAVRSALEGNPAPELCEWELIPPGPPPEPQPDQFFRLATTDLHPDSHEPRGVFCAAAILEASSELRNADRHRLKKLLRWFNRNLTVPRGVTPGAIFWFRADAGGCTSRIWQLVHLLREYGVAVQMMRTRRPGRIEYRDDSQVAAIPFADRMFRVSRV